MSHVHILDNGGLYTKVIYHIDVPNTNNSVGINWRTVVVNAGINKTALPDGNGTAGTIDATEKANVVAGSVCEVVVMEKNRGATPTLAQLWALRNGELLASLQAKYDKFGAAGG